MKWNSFEEIEDGANCEKILVNKIDIESFKCREYKNFGNLFLGMRLNYAYKNCHYKSKNNKFWIVNINIKKNLNSSKKDYSYCKKPINFKLNDLIEYLQFRKATDQDVDKIAFNIYFSLAFSVNMKGYSIVSINLFFTD